MALCTNKPPASLQTAVETFKQFCTGFPEGPFLFNGDPSDLEALGWCEYETGFPDAGEPFEYPSLIWAQVMVSLGCAKWGVTGDNSIILCTPSSDDSYTQGFLRPQERMRDLFEAEYIQFESTEILTEQFLAEFLLNGATHTEMQRLIRHLKMRRKEGHSSVFGYLGNLMRVLDRLTKA